MSVMMLGKSPNYRGREEEHLNRSIHICGMIAFPFLSSFLLHTRVRIISVSSPPQDIILGFHSVFQTLPQPRDWDMSTIWKQAS